MTSPLKSQAPFLQIKKVMSCKNQHDKKGEDEGFAKTFHPEAFRGEGIDFRRLHGEELRISCLIKTLS
jgi:hypothetical protein